MTVEFNHTIVWSRDSGASATFLADIVSVNAGEILQRLAGVKVQQGCNQ